MSRTGMLVLTVAAVTPLPALAQDADSPDLALLEYLGSWDESDEEWLVVADEFLGAPAESEPDTAALGDVTSQSGAGDAAAADVAAPASADGSPDESDEASNED